MATLVQALAVAADPATVALRAWEGLLGRVRAGLLALLEFFDGRRALAHCCVVDCGQDARAVIAAGCEGRVSRPEPGTLAGV